jgi:hypothetical protein
MKRYLFSAVGFLAIVAQPCFAEDALKVSVEGKLLKVEIGGGVFTVSSISYDPATDYLIFEGVESMPIWFEAAMDKNPRLTKRRSRFQMQLKPYLMMANARARKPN